MAPTAMNEKNGDETTSAAEPHTLQESWDAQLRMARGLLQRLDLCLNTGDPSTVDLFDAAQTLETIQALVTNLRWEAMRRQREVVSRK